MDEEHFDDMDPVVISFTILLINGNIATIKGLANNESKKNPGLQVQLGGQCVLQLGICKENWKNVPEKSKTGHLPARETRQSLTHQLWSSI